MVDPALYKAMAAVAVRVPPPPFVLTLPTPPPSKKMFKLYSTRRYPHRLEVSKSNLPVGAPPHPALDWDLLDFDHL